MFHFIAFQDSTVFMNVYIIKIIIGMNYNPLDFCQKLGSKQTILKDRPNPLEKEKSRNKIIGISPIPSLPFSFPFPLKSMYDEFLADKYI